MLAYKRDQGGVSEGDEKWLDTGHIVKVEPTGFTGRLDVVCMKEKSQG